MASPHQIEANRQNAQLSSGPKSPEGQQKSSLNSVKHGFTGRAVLLGQDEVGPYTEYTEGALKDLAPVGHFENQLAHSIIGCRWRMMQISIVEAGIYALGDEAHAHKFSNRTPEIAAAMSRALTFQESRKELDRLRRYESTLHRQAKQDLAELTALQAARTAREAAIEQQAVQLHTHFSKLKQSWSPAEFGFVLSIDQIEALAVRQLDRNAAFAVPAPPQTA